MQDKDIRLYPVEYYLLAVDNISYIFIIMADKNFRPLAAGNCRKVITSIAISF